jgi:hypothetical protein
MRGRWGHGEAGVAYLGRVRMIDLVVFVRRDAPLSRIAEVARELAAAGLNIKAISPSLGIVTGRAENHDLVPQLQAIKDVTAIKEVQPR